MIKGFFKYGLLALVIVCAFVYFRDPTFWRHYYGYFASAVFKEPRGLWYYPLEEVPGVVQPLPTAAQGSVIPTAVFDELDEYLESRNTHSFIVWHQGSILHERYFDDVNQNSPIVGKSMAKPLSTILVARAIYQGHIASLDQSAADFIHEWQGTEKAEIRVRDILNMTAGLGRFYRNTLNPFSSFHQAFLSSNHDQVTINDLALEDAPGTYYDYSQAVSDLVTVLIERSTGQRYSEYLSEALFLPLGAEGGEVWVNREGGIAHSGCCIMLPSRTWLRLGVLLAQEGAWEETQLLPLDFNAEIYAASEPNPNYGLNLWLAEPYKERRHFINPDHSLTTGIYQSEPYSAPDLFMFDGNGSQVVYIVPSLDLVILRVGDWPVGSSGDAEWDNTLLPNRIIRAIREAGFSSLTPVRPVTLAMASQDAVIAKNNDEQKD